VRQLRAAVPADVPRIWKIRHGVRENRLRDPGAVTDGEVAWYREQAIFLVAETEDGIVGFACADHLTGMIWALFVDPAHEGRGHGRALLDEALRRLAALGHRQSHLSTGADTCAARFYRAHGWRETGRAADGQVVFVKGL
jgi:ribosomal protein S18 acetylase RimI-like enzyme